MQEIIMQYQWVVLILVIWSIPWKGFALWKSARNNQKIWFIVMLIANTFAILEIIYIFFFSKDKNKSGLKDYSDRAENDGDSFRKII